MSGDGHKGNNAKWEADDTAAKASLSGIEIMASEFHRISGDDSKFVHQMENAKRELDDTVMSSKEAVNQVKSQEDQKRSLETGASKISFNQQRESFQEKMKFLTDKTNVAVQKTRRATGAKTFEEKGAEGAKGFVSGGRRGKKTTAAASREAVGDITLGFLEGKSATETAMEEAELSFNQTKVAGQTASQQTLDAADLNMTNNIRSAKTAFTNQWLSVKDALNEEQEVTKRQMQTAVVDTQGNFQNQWYNKGGWGSDKYAVEGQYGWNGFDPHGVLWKQILNNPDIPGADGYAEPLTDSVRGKKDGFRINENQESNPEPAWGMPEDLQPV